MAEVHEMSQMNILEFERRVKRFANAENKGFINQFQLMEAFNDTNIFSYLSDHSSIKTQFLFSKYVSDLSLGSKLQMRMSLAKRMSEYRSHSIKQLKSGGSTSLYMSVVDQTLSEMDDQAKAKLDPINGLDQDFKWINVSALILIGIVYCQGSDTENAEVFYRVIQPEMRKRVFVLDKDYRLALFFISLLSTILNLMQRDMVRHKQKGRPAETFNFEAYEKKMYAYETVYDAIIEEFSNDVFGLYSNTISSIQFQESLIQEGWKYFDIQNLNQFFAAKYQEKIEIGSIEALADIEEH